MYFFFTKIARSIDLRKCKLICIFYGYLLGEFTLLLMLLKMSTFIEILGDAHSKV